MGDFLARAGIEHAFALDDGLSDPVADARDRWGFDGTLQDDVFLDRVLGRLDDEHRRGGFGPERPLFVAVTTGSHHLWFDWVPARERRIYPDPQTPEERFASSLHTSDRYLGRFLDALPRYPWTRDAVFVFVGDHGFPAGEHGNHVVSRGAYEENFRTPFVLWSPGWLEPEIRRDVAHSQVDIMPTLLDLLGVDTWARMAGRSIFAPSREREPVLLVQPYDGRQLVSLRYPYKLIRRLDTGVDSMFDLAADPGERDDLLRGVVDPAHRAVAVELGPSLRAFFENQLRIRMNALVEEPAGPRHADRAPDDDGAGISRRSP